MYAVAFDLVVKDKVAHHPKHDPAAACREIGQVLDRHGFEWSDFTAIVKAGP
ncbi:MAG: virulence-associated protein D [Myxococcota bacterium]